MQLGQLFRAQRLRMNLTQAQLAENAQLEVDTIRALEAGKTIDEESLLMLAAQLKIDQQDIYNAMQETDRQQQEQAYWTSARQGEPARQRGAWEPARDDIPAGDTGRMPRAGAHAAPAAHSTEAYAAPRQEYVSPIAQDEDERLLQEIRRQRRRQAYEGTLRTQRRMQDTARMQEILRQQEAAQRAQMQQQAQPAYEQARPMQNYEPMRGEYEQLHRDYEPVRPPYESAAVTYDQAPSMEYEQERRISYDREFERPRARTMQQERMRYEQTYEQMPKAEPSLRQEPVRRGDMTDSIPRMMRSQAQPMRQGQQSTYDAYEASARQQSVQASGRRSMPVEDTHSYNQMLELAADVAQLSGRETVLEIGCGNGELTEVLASRSRFVAVVDTSAYALENCRAACAAKGFANVDFLEGDARRLPIESASFDVVYVHMLLHHVVSAPQVLVEARRVLKPGGCVVVTELMPSDVPAQQNIQNAIEVLKNPTHIGVLPMDEVMRMMRYAQLEVVDRRVLDQIWEFEQWVDAMGAQERKEPLQALMRSFALQGNRAGMDLTMDKNGRMTFINRWMYLVGVPQK